jgi:peptidoglycan/LPS O-acetylase OafA/YrhL
VVNGSLWTLPFELRCYLVLALVWWVAKFAKHAALRSFTRMVTIGTALMLLAFWISHAFGYKHWHTFRLFFMFFSGAVFWMFRERIPMKGGIALVAAFLLLAGAAFPKYFFWIYPPTIGYLVLYLAYVPGGPLRLFNRFGDYSYGIYIYAFPVQQMFAASVPGIGPMAMFAGSTVFTLVLGILSWHLVEKPMLARKDPKPLPRLHGPSSRRTID